MVHALCKKILIGPSVKSMFKKKAKLMVCHVDQLLYATHGTPKDKILRIKIF